MQRDFTLTTAQAREIDRRATEEFGIPSLLLMENAGRGAADLLCRLCIDGRVVIVCGRGNNGGDGFVIARHLDLRGYDVQVFVVGEASTLKPGAAPSDAAINLEIVRRSGIPLVENADLEAIAAAAREASWIVDALLGTGAHGEPRPAFATVIEAVNASGRPVLAVDVPSGLNADTGRPAKTTILATRTATFVAPKAGFVNPQAIAVLGELHVLDIGAPRELIKSSQKVASRERQRPE